MTCPSNICLDLSLRSDTDEQHHDNIWRLSFLSSNGPFTIGDSVMKNNIISTMVARNLLTLKDSRILSKRSDELAFKTLWLSVFIVLALFPIWANAYLLKLAQLNH
ncbi:hypothetical protein ACFX2G_034935 [Malus domestica]